MYHCRYVSRTTLKAILTLISHLVQGNQFIICLQLNKVVQISPSLVNFVPRSLSLQLEGLDAS